MFLIVHYREFPYEQGNRHYYPGMFYQLLYTNQYFLNTILVSSHIQTHTSVKVLFSSLNFCLSNQAFGYLNDLKYFKEWWKFTSEKKGQFENSHKQLELKYIPSI